MAKRSLSKKPKPGKLDTYWQLFAAFVFTMNESGTYRETIDRVNFFNAEQKILKRVPKSADATNACMIKYARGLFGCAPKEKQWSMYDYRRLLVKNLYYHSCWLQDNFHLLFGETCVYSVMKLFDDLLPKRFGELYPDVAEIERMAAESVANARSGFEPTHIAELEAYRAEHPNALPKLRAFLCDGRPAPDGTAIETVKWAAKTNTQEVFSWFGKDIAEYLAELAENMCSRLNFKEQLFEKEIERDGALKWKDMECHVSKIEQCNPDAEVQQLDMEKNHYIEGDNLRALRLLKPQYEGKIKMIYIDPPYNTGQKFVYVDDFKSDDAIFRRLLFARFPLVNFGEDNVSNQT